MFTSPQETHPYFLGGEGRFPRLFLAKHSTWRIFKGYFSTLRVIKTLAAQCSATPASSCYTPLWRDTFSETAWRATLLAVQGRQVRQGLLGGGCSAILLLHLKTPQILRKSAATRVARHGVPLSPHTCATMLLIFHLTVVAGEVKPCKGSLVSL